MKYTILTLFPEVFTSYLEHSIIKRAIDRGIISVNVMNIRDYTTDPHKRCDDKPYGGGYGMILTPDPIARALDACHVHDVPIVLPTPSATLFTQKDAAELSQNSEIIFICGKYEGIDERIRELYVTHAFSVGRYVLSSGEVATLVMIDSIYRLIDGVIRKESLLEESYSNDLLEYPQYTRPVEFRGHRVPDVLVSGNHKEIAKWRLSKSIERTKECREDTK